MDMVRVPVDLLLDSAITASAKVVWMVLRLYPELTKQGRPSPTQLAKLTGLSRPTVRKGLARLSVAGWYRLSPESKGPATLSPSQSPPHRGTTSVRQPQGSPQVCRASETRSHANSHGSFQASPSQPRARRFVWIPSELVEDHTVRPQGVVMYGVLLATPGFSARKGKYTRRQLREMTGRALKTIRRTTNMLAAYGWLELTRKNHFCPFLFTVKNPVREAYDAKLARMAKRIDRARFMGEELMRSYLTLIADSDEFEDDAAPGFLVNPFTHERMQLDQYYPGRVAFEFNGPQHYKPTEFATPQDVEKQQARDCIKAMICRNRGIRLVVAHPEDLTLQTMIQKVGTHLPLRDLRSSRPILRYLENTSRHYRRVALEGQTHPADRAVETRQPMAETNARH